jgi:hypothetical protein
MNDLARLFTPDEGLEALRKLGGLLLGLGLFMVFVRKSDEWGDWGLLLVLLVAFAFLYGVGLLGRLSTGTLRPWGAVYLVFGILLSPFVLLQFVDAIGGDPGASMNVFWIWLVVAALAAATAVVAGARYTLLLAALAAIVSWSALWDAIFSGGIAEHTGAYRVVLLVLAALLLLAALVVSLGVEEGEPGGTRARDIVTGAAVAAVVAAGLSLSEVVASPFLSVPSADSSLFWEIVLLLVSLAAVAYGSRVGARGPTYVGAIGLLAFVLIAGGDINDSTPDPKIVGWPLILLIAGGAAFFAGILPGLRGQGPQYSGRAELTDDPGAGGPGRPEQG